MGSKQRDKGETSDNRNASAMTRTGTRSCSVVWGVCSGHAGVAHGVTGLTVRTRKAGLALGAACSAAGLGGGRDEPDGTPGLADSRHADDKTSVVIRITT